MDENRTKVPNTLCLNSILAHVPSKECGSNKNHISQSLGKTVNNGHILGKRYYKKNYPRIQRPVAFVNISRRAIPPVFIWIPIKYYAGPNTKDRFQVCRTVCLGGTPSTMFLSKTKISNNLILCFRYEKLFYCLDNYLLIFFSTNTIFKTNNINNR